MPRRSGKIRHVGVSNYDVKQMEELARFGRVETLQPPYHMFRREIEEEILPYAMDHDWKGVKRRTWLPASDGRSSPQGGPTALCRIGGSGGVA